MTTTNPLKQDALTADTINFHDKIIVWKPGDTRSTRHYVVANTPYIDDDGDMVVDLLDTEGQPHVLLTSEAGLTGGRYDGAWTHIAILDEEE